MRSTTELRALLRDLDDYVRSRGPLDTIDMDKGDPKRGVYVNLSVGGHSVDLTEDELDAMVGAFRSARAGRLGRLRADLVERGIDDPDG